MTNFADLVTRSYVCATLGGNDLISDDHYVSIWDMADVDPCDYDNEIDVDLTMMITGYLDY